MSSNSSIIKSIGLPLIAFVTIVGINHFMDGSHHKNIINGDRKFASLLPERHEHAFRHTTKLAHSLEVSFTKNEFADGQLKVTAVVVSPNEYSEMDFKWSLPSSLKLESGEENILGEVISANSANQYSIVVTGHLEENHKIHFIIQSKDSTKPLFLSKQFNTRDEAVIAQEKRDLFVRSNEYEAQKKGFLNKVFK